MKLFVAVMVVLVLSASIGVARDAQPIGQNVVRVTDGSDHSTKIFQFKDVGRFKTVNVAWIPFCLHEERYERELGKDSRSFGILSRVLHLGCVEHVSYQPGKIVVTLEKNPIWGWDDREPAVVMAIAGFNTDKPGIYRILLFPGPVVHSRQSTYHDYLYIRSKSRGRVAGFPLLVPHDPLLDVHEMPPGRPSCAPGSPTSPPPVHGTTPALPGPNSSRRPH